MASEIRSGRVDLVVDAPDALSQEREQDTSNKPTKTPRRRACNECKQQKLRCDLATADDEPPTACTRCQKFGLECKVESAFQRSRKRRRSFELENEVKELRRQLSQYASNNAPLRPSRRTSTTLPVPLDLSEGVRLTDSDAVDLALPPDEPVQLPRPDHPNLRPSIDVSEMSPVAGLTTKPVIDQPQPVRRTTAPAPRPRTLGGVTLSVDEISEVFSIFNLRYHPYLPFLDPNTSPHLYYESSELLFWAIVSVASRHMQNQPTLLPTLGRIVTDLLWKTLRSIPYSLRVVQSLVLLCAWPFPTSSSTADPTYMLAGMMVQVGTQMGLHRALSAQDFTKVPLSLDMYEYNEWIKTWEACNIVAQSVSVGCGLPATLQMQDWSLTVAPESSILSPDDVALRTHLRIEQFRHRVSQALTSNALDPTGFTSTRERLSLYRLLDACLLDLEREALNITSINRFYLSAARLHLHSFYLFDESSIDGYADRIVTLYHTAHSTIEQSLSMDSQEGSFLHCCPFFCYQVLVSASLIVLKISNNEYFKNLLDIGAGKKLINSSISALRKMSVANNDLPARLSDVIAFFCSLPSVSIDEGRPLQQLQLRVRNRLSMSIVYDSLWEWRKHFQSEESADDQTAVNDIDEYRRRFPQSSSLANIDLRMLFNIEDLDASFFFGDWGFQTDGFNLT